MNKRTKKHRNLRIAVVGIDGCGKSSCYRAMLDRLVNHAVAGIGDSVIISAHGTLQPASVPRCRIKSFLGSKAKDLKNRTLYKLLKFSELVLRVKIQRAIEYTYRPAYVITDGSPLVNTVAWGNYYHSDLFNEQQCAEVIRYMTGARIPLKRIRFYYKHLPEVFLINMLRIRFQMPDLLFFLAVDPVVALARIDARHKRRQVHETAAFLTSLQDAYHLTCRILEDHTEIHIIDTNGKTVEQVTDEMEQALP